MEPKRKRLALAEEKKKPSDRKRLLLRGEGVVSVNIQASNTFAIRIRPAQQPIGDNKTQKEQEADEHGYVEVEISPSRAIFKAKNPSSGLEEGPATQSGGIEEKKKVSYWFSFNRDDRVLKYGKGYIMEQTTLLEWKLPKRKKISDPWEFIFCPETAKKIVIIDALADQTEQKSLGVENPISFYPHPLKRNWPHLILDSSKATLEMLSSDLFTMSASLPTICRELYENAAGITLDWPYKNPKFPDVINYSLTTKGKILYEKLEEKKKKGQFQYLRVNAGTDHGSSPGNPYELEIWPPKSESPIHNHGNAYAVEKVLYGAIKFTIYNKTWNKEDTQQELMSFTAAEGDISWMSPNWYQTHKLKNESTELFCATLQCYKYGQDDELMWPYLDCLKGSKVDEFLPKGDFKSFVRLQKELLEEYKSDHPDCPILPVMSF